jgi:hypothetical protein
MDLDEANPKHKEPWQPGRKGSLCPRWTTEAAQHLLDQSVVAPDGKRFATAQGIAFTGQQHRAGFWHGYPIPWFEVPEVIRRRGIEEGIVKRKAIKESWYQVLESSIE